ncbi:2,3,4,5-tetrahydropyridine-2,6-dicarboxylate N-acetyltransferase [Pseudoalteromonas haloplanktis]|uniref:2,3,4,5-tetrahydropyridine-2,6-dicarboxylate N-acetyltransferase n=1 Tax=Pseudoalteromonas haloplanktis TaxID=228 RepID=A0A9W4R2Q9_PSEHA|nr:acyltransferase [Pseudoalteromonas haloplanktis]CAH9065473.1 2,3,4,5-tetrahydropyridine-2,6-dicarboxylate N-acetyltransferase [Pseudoalteromonas haloplanktis]
MLNKLYIFLYIRLFGQKRYAKKIGVKFGQDCSFNGLSKFGSEPYLIKMGDHVRIVSVNFVNHDGGVWVLRDTESDLDLVDTITIGDNVFIGQETTLLPGTIIGNNVVIGARSLVKGTLEPNYVYAGVPAKKICTLEEYKEKLLTNGIRTKHMDAITKKQYLLKFFKI